MIHRTFYDFTVNHLIPHKAIHRPENVANSIKCSKQQTRNLAITNRSHSAAYNSPSDQIQQ